MNRQQRDTTATAFPAPATLKEQQKLWRARQEALARDASNEIHYAPPTHVDIDIESDELTIMDDYWGLYI